MILALYHFLYFFFSATPTTEIYTLSLHDALPIWFAVVLEIPRDLRITDAVQLTERVAPERVDRGSRRRSVIVLVLAIRVGDRKSTRLNSSHMSISYAVFCLKKKKKHIYLVKLKCH